MKIYEGVRVDNKGNVVFNWKYDDRSTDCLLLDGLEANEFNENGVKYVYGYNYTTKATREEKKIIRTFLKNVENFEEVDDFVDNGVLKLNAIADIRMFDAFVYVKPRKPLSLMSRISEHLLDYSTPFSTSFELVKKCYNEVTFDRNKLIQELSCLGWKEVDIEDTVNSVEYRFKKLKQSGSLFEMKKFIPRQVRVAFTDFMKFSTEEQKELFLTLQGANILVYDDFLTSGSTVKEIVRYLTSINSDNNITIFVLVNQNEVD